MFCEEKAQENLMQKIQSFSGIQVGPRILLLKSADFFGTSGRVKEESIVSKTSISGADGEANWSGVVNFHCFIYSAMSEMTCHVHHFFCSLAMV